MTTQSRWIVRFVFRKTRHVTNQVQRSLSYGLVAVFLSLTAPVTAQMGDASAGKAMLWQRRCTVCHPINGVGSGEAPDLGRRAREGYTEALLAASMWNHAPRMWEEMARRLLPVPQLSQVEIANLYAYFHSLRYFDPTGDTARGKTVFDSKKCSQCHAMTSGGEGIAPPISQLLTSSDPVLWVQRMWNHAGEMAAIMEQQGIAWPRFTLQEMADLLTFFESTPQLGGFDDLTVGLYQGDWSIGQDLFVGHSCSQCHTLEDPVQGKIDLARTVQERPSLSALAVEMWNHRPLMEQAASERGITLKPFEGHQMADLIAYLLRGGYFQVQGESERGQEVFTVHGCGSCHGAEELRRARFTAIQFAAAVWKHGPSPKTRMGFLGLKWPTVTERDVEDLAAFLSRK